jgi:uncharacterized Zn-binding protein involved in type VI secretion
VGDDDKAKGTGVPPGSSAGAEDKPVYKPVSSGPKLALKRELAKKEGPKGERAIGNRKPEAKDPNAPPKPNANELSAGPLFTFKTHVDSAVYHPKDKLGQDQSFVQGLKYKMSDVEVGSMSLKLNEAKANVTLVKFEAEGSVVHGETDLAELVKKWLFGEPKVKPAGPPDPPSGLLPMAARLGDMTTHGAPLLPGPGSPDVMIGGMPAWRIGLDMAMCPFPGAAPHGTGPTSMGAPTVFINGMPAARVGDFVVEPTGGPNVIVVGCPSVMIGSPASPAPSTPAPKKDQELPSVVFGATATADMVSGSANASAVADIDGKKGKGKIEGVLGVEAAVFKAKLPLSVKLRIPWTRYYLGLGLTTEASALTVAAEVGGGVSINEGSKVFGLTGGAKIGAGLFGLGAKFSVDVSQ